MPLGFHLQTPYDEGEREQLGELLARNMAAANILGRLQVIKHAHAKTGRMFPLSEHARRVFFSEGDQDQDETAPDATLGTSFDIGGAEAAARIRELTPVTRGVFDGLTALYKRDAFTLAGAADARLVEKIRDALADAAARGETISDWRKAVAEITSEEGADELNAFTLDTAFQIAMQKTYSAGRLEQMQQPDVMDALPFWQYWTVGDARVRAGHAELDGFIARAMDPVWMKIYPPWDFGCRCSVAPLLASEALAIDKDAGEDGMVRVRTKPFTMLELATSRFGTLLAV